MLFCLPQEEASHFPIEGNREGQILDNVAVHLDPTAGRRAGAAAFVIRYRLLWLTGAQQGDDERPIAFPIAGRRPGIVMGRSEARITLAASDRGPVTSALSGAASSVGARRVG